jgi:acetyl esterase/lipase
MLQRRLLVATAFALVLTACGAGTARVETTTPPASTVATPATTTTDAPPATSAPPTTGAQDTTTTTTAQSASTVGEPDPTLLYSNYVRTESYGNGLELDIHAPEEVGPWPVVVTIHGGGWFIGDRQSMGSLADGLASRKAVVFNATYRTLTLGGTFPGMVDDVACAVQFARNAASEFTTTPETVTVVGHSAGAHLASLVAYAPGVFGQECPEGPMRSPDALVGLAGPYDISQLGGLLTPMFGVPIADDPELWASGNPFSWIPDSPDLPTLLLHGDADRVAPIEFSEELAGALEAAGRDVTFEALEGRSHSDLNSPRVVGDRIAAFLNALGSP